MNIFIITLAAILVIAFIWLLVKESKSPEITSLEIPKVAELITEDKEWLDAPLVTEEPEPVVVVEPVAVVEPEVVVEPAVVVEPVIVVEPKVVVEPEVEVKPVTVAPKKKSTRRYPAKKKPNNTK
jgi:outer membrane biosynthesis protein TonB